MIKLNTVGLTYGNRTVALDNVNISIEAGTLTYIIGASGSGKTSLLKLLMGMEYPTVGNLTVLNQNIVKGKQGRIRKLRRDIGPIFQEFRLIDGRTAIENVMLGMRFLTFNNREIKENAISALERVGLGHKLYSDVSQLSYGECQRVAIARAVARKPSLILADEPTGNLDHDNAVKILELLASFVDDKTSVIITTHATHLIPEDTNARIIKVQNGRISNYCHSER